MLPTFELSTILIKARGNLINLDEEDFDFFNTF